MQLFEKNFFLKKSCIDFLESALKSKHFEKKNEPDSSSISEVIDSEKLAYLNVQKMFFLKTLWQ